VTTADRAVVTALLIIITEYYTATKYRPVHETARASETGAGTNVIIGLAMGEALAEAGQAPQGITQGLTRAPTGTD
jgi:Na+/H+-translocating membrane pyrophosphatase